MLSARKDMMLHCFLSRLLRMAYVSAKPVTILSRAFAHALSGFLKTPPDLYEHLHPSLQDESKMMCSRPR